MLKTDRLPRLVVTLVIGAFTTSDLAIVAHPASAQQGGSGPNVGLPSNGYHTGPPAPAAPSPGSGADGLLPPTRQAPGDLQRRPPTPVVNVCHGTGVSRTYQTVMVPRTPGPSPNAPQGPGVTQATLTQGGAPQTSGSPTSDPRWFGRPGQAAESVLSPDVEELSRIEAAFNLDSTVQLLAAQQAAASGRPYQGGLPPNAPAPTAAVQQAALSQNPGAGSAPAVTPPSPTLAFIGPFGVPLRQFGYTMFAANVSTFAPVDDIPVGPDYILGPGDDLTINVWGPVDSTIERTVDRSGRIVLPKVGDLRLWGLTFSQADRLIREQLSRYFRGFQTSVTMGRLRTVRVHVVGEVCQPGLYTLSSLATLTNALFSAGGPTKLGSLRDVRLLRNHHSVGTLDLYEFLLRGDRTRDFRLESGDTIFVPTIGDVAAVAGEVKRPAIYELRGEVRVADLIAMTGGVTATGYLKRVQIVRAQPSAERVTLDVDLSRYYAHGDTASNPAVNGGDLVLIHRSDSRIYNTVKVEGAVKYPGTYELKPMMRMTDLLAPDHLLPEANARRVEIARRRPDLSIEIVPVDLQKAWAGNAEQNLALKPLDEVTVRTELREARTVTLNGQVARPGKYTLAEGERLSSVLARAGGFTDRAFLRGAVFTRDSLRKVEQERLDSFVRLQEQRILATASTTVVGAEKEEVQATQQALQARRDLLRALAAKVVVGRMVVSLDTPEKLRGTESDIVLVEGDSLDVPEPPSGVLVLGAVRNSTSVLHKDGANTEYYVNRVGGFTKEADKKEVHVVKADGSAVSSFAKIRSVEPGDTIVVPPKEEEKVRTLPAIRDIAQVIGSALLSFAALAVLF